jgi:hypothetical protein
MIMLVFSALLWAQFPRRQFAYEWLEEDTRPKPDLTPVPSGKGEKGVRFKAKAGWQPNGIAVATGVYFYRMQVNGFASIKKVALIK